MTPEFCVAFESGPWDGAETIGTKSPPGPFIVPSSGPENAGQSWIDYWLRPTEDHYALTSVADRDESQRWTYRWRPRGGKRPAGLRVGAGGETT